MILHHRRGTSEASAGRGASLALVLILAIASALPIAYRLFQPLVTPADNNTAMFGMAARNMVRHGPAATRLGLALNTGEQRPDRFAFTTHHPPLAAVGAALVFIVLGSPDWAARIYPGACSLGSALLVFALWRRCRGPLPAALASMAMAALPAFGHLGKMLGEEAPTLFFGLLAIFLYLRWKDGAGGLGLALAAYAAGCLSGWASFYIGPILMVHATLTLKSRPADRRRAIAALGLTGVTTFLLILAHFLLLVGTLQPLFDSALNRGVAGAQGAPSVPYLTGDDSLLARLAGHAARIFGTSWMWLAGVGAAAGALAFVRGRTSGKPLATLLLLGVFGVAHPVVFRWAAYYHDWLLFHLLPILGIAIGEGVVALAALARSTLRGAGLPAPAASSAAFLCGSLAFGLHAVTGASGLARLSIQDASYARPIVGEAVRAAAPPRSTVMANVPFRDPALRYYADRPSTTVTRDESYAQLRPMRDYTLYVRFPNVGIDPALERRLGARPGSAFASVSVYDLRDPPGELPLFEPGDRRRIARADTDIVFGDRIRLDVVTLEGPPLSRPALPRWRRFLGLEGSPLASRVVTVAARWATLAPSLPDWKVETWVIRTHREGPGYPLPPVAIPGWRDADLAGFAGRDSFVLESSFLLPLENGHPELKVRIGVREGGTAVPPIVDGIVRPAAKFVELGPFRPPARGERR